MIRKCTVCGKPIRDGMTNDGGDFYIHEECFEKYMDETYGKHKWMEINDDGAGGYYIYSNENVVGGYDATGAYYTDWSEIMKVKELIEYLERIGEDVDVYDDVCDEIGIAFCGGIKLTEEGTKKFEEVLDYNVDVDITAHTAIIHVDDEEGIWQKKLKKAKQFFYSAAGYCADEDYQKWFVEVG